MKKTLYETNAYNKEGLYGTAYADSGLKVQTSSPLKPEDPGTNPEELFGLAWSTCLNATIEIALKRHRYTGIASEVRVNVTYRSSEERSGYTYFDLKVYATIDLPKDEAQAIFAEAHRRCPVSMIVGDYTAVAYYLNGQEISIN